MELVATRQPFLSFPLQRYFEQCVHVRNGSATLENRPQMRLRYRDHPIQALTSRCPDRPLVEGIRGAPPLVLGPGTRFAALALFLFNIVAATSYPDLSDAGLKDHVLWGALMMVLFFYGPGKIAMDRWLER